MHVRILSIAIGLLLALHLSAAPVCAQGRDGSGTVALVSSPLANLRQTPEAKSPIVTQLLLAEEVRILEKREYRYRIVAPEQGGIEGWVHEAALVIPRDGGAAYLREGRQRIVISSPRTRALVLDKLGDHALSLYAGTRLPVLEKSERGYVVQFPDRRTSALLPAADVRPVTARHPLFSPGTPDEIAATARKFIGIRAFAGGRTEQGMDTRGLISAVYRIYGMNVSMSDEGLRAGATQVPKSDLEPGDILLFHGEGLGLYLGSGSFLHAPAGTRLQVGGLHDRRFANAFRYGLRLLGPAPEHRKRPAEMTADEIMVTQGLLAELPAGGRIAYWAGRFIGTPYDPDPLGLYVRSNRIVADEMADCMYLTFRAVELARSSTPGEAVEQALHLRFFTEGKIVDGLVQNYAERYEYGEDMVFSGKWGKNITDDLGTTTTIPGSRGRGQVIVIPKASLATRKVQQRLRDGDIVFWVKDPSKRVVEEIVAHLAIVRIKNGLPFLIHASGSKNKWSTPNGGMVKEVPFADYLRDTKFIGAFVTRFEE